MRQEIAQFKEEYTAVPDGGVFVLVSNSSSSWSNSSNRNRGGAMR